MDLESLKDLTYEEAVAKIEAAGFTHRIRSEDGQVYHGTCDMQPKRVNLHLANKIVKSANLG